MAFQGLDIRQTGDRIVFRALLQDYSGAIVTSGTANLKIYELQNDGTLKSYDFSSNTFKTTALTTENQALTHRTGNNSTTNTGIWTYALTTLTGFTAGNIYLARVDHASALPVEQVREFQFGVDASTPDPYSARMRRAADSIVRGTVTTGGTTTSIPTSSLDPAAAVADQFKGRVVIFDRDTTTANLRGQARDITASSSGGTLTVSALTDAPASGDTFVIL